MRGASIGRGDDAGGYSDRISLLMVGSPGRELIRCRQYSTLVPRRLVRQIRNCAMTHSPTSDITSVTIIQSTATSITHIGRTSPGAGILAHRFRRHCEPAHHQRHFVIGITAVQGALRALKELGPRRQCAARAWGWLMGRNAQSCFAAADLAP